MIQGCSSDEAPTPPLPPSACDGVPVGLPISFWINGEIDKRWGPVKLLPDQEWGFHGGRDTFGIWVANGGICGRREEKSEKSTIDITFIPLRALDISPWPISVKIAQASFFYNDVLYTRIDSTSWGEVTSVGEHDVLGRFEARLYDSTGRLMIDLKDGDFSGSR